MNHTLFKSTLALVAALAASSALAAGSAVGSGFSLSSSSLYPGEAAPLDAPASNGVVATGLTPRLDTPNAQASDGFISYGIYWLDGDSFDLLVRADDSANFANDIDSATLRLSGLTFQDGALPVSTLNVSFNLAASDLSGYLQSPDNPTGASMPGIGATTSGLAGASQVEIQLFGYSGQLVGDQAILRFDVQTAAVPEPATYGLMALGLVGVAAWSRRRQVSRRA